MEKVVVTVHQLDAQMVGHTPEMAEEMVVVVGALLTQVKLSAAAARVVMRALVAMGLTLLVQLRLAQAVAVAVVVVDSFITAVVAVAVLVF